MWCVGFLIAFLVRVRLHDVAGSVSAQLDQLAMALGDITRNKSLG